MSAVPSRKVRVSQVEEQVTHPVTDLHTAPVRTPPPKDRFGVRLATAAVILVFALGPMLLWRGGWSAFRNDDQQIALYLKDSGNVRMLEAAARKIGERIRAHEPASQWYPQLLQLASYPDQNVRHAAAWALGQDPQRADFHRMLLNLLNGDTSAEVRNEAALSLLNFGDRSGHAQIVESLEPARVAAPRAGRVVEASRSGDTIRSGEGIVRLRDGESDFDVASPITGRIRRMLVRADDVLSPGVPVAVIDPAPEHANDALHALYLIGEAGDLQAVTPYLHDIPEMPAYVREQAKLTQDAITSRMK